MGKKYHVDEDEGADDAHYKKSLYALQVELVKLQRSLLEKGERVLVIIEGRDGAGKDGTIARLTEHMSPRDTRVHAPSKPSDKEETQWYFQRFVSFLPSGGEFVIFNRSWYNRAGVERVMDFCSKDDTEKFYRSVVPFEDILVRDGLHLRKYYLDISRKEQKARLEARRESPLKQWKISPVDEKALQKWDAYTKARDEMFKRTSHAMAPWTVVHSDEKKIARLEFLRDLLGGFSYPGKKAKLTDPDRKIAYQWSDTSEDQGLLNT